MNINENNSFIAFPSTQTGVLLDESEHEKFPLRYFNEAAPFSIDTTKSYFVFVYEGCLVLDRQDGRQHYIRKNHYASFKGFDISKVSRRTDFKAVVIEVDHKGGVYPETNFYAANIIAGPLEKEGRLKYIDGCTDSLLIPPIKLGDPCLNHLHFPNSINQTPHTHPSHRIGLVTKGYGECITPFGNLPLTEGTVFVIKEWDGISYATGLDGKEYPVGTHSFKTTNSVMDVVAFHPDSDFGATDINHPMINRTIVDGVSANKLKHLQTK